MTFKGFVSNTILNFQKNWIMSISMLVSSPLPGDMHSCCH